ncbi:MAG: hypothetical protein LC127_03540 [Chitinophagales bacterium]|nr:hypothetical protein [Chitinophagales bacterium]
MTVAFRAMQNIHGQANRDLINSYIKRREFIESGKINEVKLTPKMSLEDSGFGEEFRAEFLKAVDWAQNQMNERLGDDQSVGRLLDQWTLEGQAAGKVVVRALQEQGDATANAVRDASIKAIAAMADAEGNLKLYRAQSKERSSLFAIGESFSLSPFGATVGGAYGGWSPESLENIDHLIELTVKLSDVVAALGNDTEKGMLAAGSASEVIADLTSILKDVANLDGLHVNDSYFQTMLKLSKSGMI